MEEETPHRRVIPQAIAARVCAALNETGSKYLVIGGVACVLHGYVRATTDVDILAAHSLPSPWQCRHLRVIVLHEPADPGMLSLLPD